MVSQASGEMTRISGANFDSEVRSLSTGLFHMKRSDHYSRPKGQIDCFASAWFVGVADLAPGRLWIRDGKSWLEASGRIGVLMPAFTLAEWRISEGELEWSSYSASDERLPEDLPDVPCVFPWDGESPKDFPSLVAWLRRARLRRISQEKTGSRAARETKRHIDGHFREDLRIQGVADALGLSRIVMTREFTRCYGISPVSYRHRLRVFEAMRLMSKGQSATTAMLNAGFSTPSRFNQHFKKYLGTTPRSYRIRER